MQRPHLADPILRKGRIVLQSKTQVAQGHGADESRRLIARPGIDDDDFEQRSSLRAKSFETGANALPFVQGRHNHAYRRLPNAPPPGQRFDRGTSRSSASKAGEEEQEGNELRENDGENHDGMKKGVAHRVLRHASNLAPVTRGRSRCGYG